MRKFELFSKLKLNTQTCVSNVPRVLYKQERDWTCSIACIRTLLSNVSDNVLSEDEFISIFKLAPSPYYSKDIKSLCILSNIDVVYGCDFDEVTFDTVLDYLSTGYYVMVECMINYAHWLVLLGYFPVCNNNVEASELLLYDPYYDKVRLVNVDEFVSMWIDGDYGNTNVKCDFIAIK